MKKIILILTILSFSIQTKSGKSIPLHLQNDLIMIDNLIKTLKHPAIIREMKSRKAKILRVIN